MEHIPNVVPKTNFGHANNLASSQQVAPHKHFSTWVLSTGNVSSVLTPIKESAPPNQTRPSGQLVVKQTKEQINKELIDEVTRLSSKPKDRTARNMDKGFETFADAQKQLMQNLLLSAEQLEDEIPTLKLSSTPSTSENYLDRKHQLFHVKQAIKTLKSLKSTSDKSARRQAP